MRAFVHAIDGTPENARAVLGAMVCRSVRVPGGKRALEKGQAITESDVPLLQGLAGTSLSLLALDEGDLHEDEAAMRLAIAASGQGIRVTGPAGARARLVAGYPGLLVVDARSLAAMNALPAVSVYTLFDGQPVAEGTVVAEAKVTPLAVPAAEIEQAEALARANPPVSVIRFKLLRAAALVRERISPQQARRMADGLSRKLGWFGSSLDGVQYVSPDEPPEQIAARLRTLLDEGAELLFLSGGSAADPADPLLNAVEQIPARLERIGVPAHPGSMLWLAYAGVVPLLGVPSCGVFSEATSLDLVLPRLLAGQSISAQTMAELGHGGLLAPNDRRFPRYG